MRNRRTDDLPARVRALCREYDLLPAGSAVLAAVSGGADSMCLLSLLAELAPQWGFSLFAAHYHHGLRGAEADRDAAFVAEQCRLRGIPCYMGRGNVAEEAAERKAGIEETARQMRYDFLEQTAAGLSPEGNCQIATAHHGDDQTETVLLHLVRGSGLQGLTGMAPKRGNIIRPLLCVEREQIEAYNREREILWVEDDTNGDDAYSRNYLRHQVIPLLKEINPALNDSVRRMAKGLALDLAWLEQCTEAQLPPHKPGEVAVEDLLRLPEALQPRAVQYLLQECCPGEALGMEHRYAVLALAAGKNPSGRIDLPGGLTAERQYDKLILRKKMAASAKTLSMQLPLPGQLDFQGGQLRAEAGIYSGQRGDKLDLWIATKETFLLVRNRRTGDRLCLPKRPEKTVKKWMIENRIPRGLRDGLPVLTDCKGQILAVIGLGTDQCAVPKVGEPAWHLIWDVEE